MKTRILILLSVYFTTGLSTIAQNWMSFVYDEAGNRVRREIVINQGSRSMDKSEDKGESYYDALGDKMVKITRVQPGIVKVTILNMDSDDKCYIDVCSIDGMQVFIEPQAGEETIINLSDNAMGIYILRVVVNAIPTIWKITRL